MQAVHGPHPAVSVSCFASLPRTPPAFLEPYLKLSWQHQVTHLWFLLLFLGILFIMCDLCVYFSFHVLNKPMWLKCCLNIFVNSQEHITWKSFSWASNNNLSSYSKSIFDSFHRTFIIKVHFNCVFYITKCYY